MKTNIRRKALGTLALLVGLAGALVPGECEDVFGVQGAVSQVPEPGQQLRFGAIRVDAKNRVLMFPARVLRREGEVELGIVTPNGLVDRSLLVTEAHPVEIHAAFLLLGISGQTVPPLLGETQQDGDWVKLEKMPELKGHDIWMGLKWVEGGVAKRVEFEECVRAVDGTAVEFGPWVYTGSYLQPNGLFAAQGDGSVLSFVKRPEALINNPRPGRADLHGWEINSGKVPAPGTEVTVVVVVGSVPKESLEK